MRKVILQEFVTLNLELVAKKLDRGALSLRYASRSTQALATGQR